LIKRGQTVVDQSDPANDPVITSLSSNWNGMFESIRSLIYSISGGADWGELSAPFWIIHPFCGVAYVAFVIVTVIGLLNILVGIFVQEANELSKWDEDLVVDAFVHRRKEQTEEIFSLFDRVDVNRTGHISFDMLSRAMQNDAIAAYFEHLDVEPIKVEVLFGMLDINGDGKITKEEFLEGLSKLHGSASATGVATVLVEEKRMNTKLEEIETHICQFIEEKKMNTKLDDIETHICQRLDSLQDEILRETRGVSSCLSGTFHGTQSFATPAGHRDLRPTQRVMG